MLTWHVHACREQAAAGAVPLIPVKVQMSKVLSRLRQFARGHANAEGVLLNPQNVAAMHKAAHLARSLRTRGAYAGAHPGGFCPYFRSQLGTLR